MRVSKPRLLLKFGMLDPLMGDGADEFRRVQAVREAYAKDVQFSRGRCARKFPKLAHQSLAVMGRSLQRRLSFPKVYKKATERTIE